MSWTLYHNPRCSKSRAALSLLREKGIEVEVIEYLKNPPRPSELDAICRRLGCEPTALMREKEKVFSELGLSLSDSRGREEWINLICANPILMERPIALHGDKAVVGRPPENVLRI